jgi:hypothetical protein
MRELNRYDFTNDRYFVIYLLLAADQEHLNLPECDVIGFLYNDSNKGDQVLAMRPDEALILARLLIDAVWQTTEGYSVGTPTSLSRAEAFRPY